MIKFFAAALGAVSGLGGFLEIGCIAAAAQAGALFGSRLLWAVVLGAICVAVIVPHLRRLTELSGRRMVGRVRERLGSRASTALLVSLGLVALLVLTAEIGGVSIALEFATDVSYRVWAAPVALATLIVTVRKELSWIGHGMSAFAIMAIAFFVGAVEAEPDLGRAARALLPSLPEHDFVQYAFLAAALVGAAVTRAVFFYAPPTDSFGRTLFRIGADRAAAGVGIAFGTFMTAVILILAATTLLPRDIPLDRYWDLPLLLKYVFGKWGIALVAASLAVTCFAAALRVVPVVAALFAHARGAAEQHHHVRLSSGRVSIAALAIACIVVVAGPDPLRFAVFAMAACAALAPFALPALLVAGRSRRDARGAVPRAD